MKPQKKLNMLRIIFGISAIVLLLIAIGAAFNTNRFLEKAVATEGVVIDLVEKGSTDSGNTLYAPVVAFTTKEGEQVEFVSASSSYPPAYELNESIEVLYLPEKPTDAKIKGTFSLWGVSIITGILGVVFSIFPLVLFLIGNRKAKLKEMLLRNGYEIKAQYLGVRQNQSLSVGGAHPYIIEAQWQEPVSKKLHVFKSENIWFNPESFVNAEEIKVWIDHPKQPKKYWMDISFLPEMAG